MRELGDSLKSIRDVVTEETKSNPDYIFKKVSFMDYDICVLFCESLVSRISLDEYILKFFTKGNKEEKEIKDVIEYLEKNIPANKITRLSTYEQLYYNVCSGFSIVIVDGCNEVLSIETKETLNSPIADATNETVLKGPNDAFTENYQTNIGMIRRRLKTSKLFIKETLVGKISKNKVAVFYIDGIGSEELANYLFSKIEEIEIDAIMDSNYVIDTINGNTDNALPTYLPTERPDLVAEQLLKGKIAVLVENSKSVIILPVIFLDIFHNPEDNYQTPINANYTKVIRFIAFLMTVLTPAIYIAMITYNPEMIPTDLLVNFSMQRDGVPIPSVIEALIMLLTFEILRETDARIPNIIGSSLSIVGALVLGDAAVIAGLVSPIMVIVIAITSISSFILSFFDVTNGCRWWRLLFILFASVSGVIGVITAIMIMIINLSSVKSLGVPYLMPISPLKPKEFLSDVFSSKKGKFLRRPSYFTENTKKGKDS